MKSTVKLAGARKVSGGVVLKNPVRITEDEADAIVSRRALRDKKRFPLEEVLRAGGYKLEH